MEYIEGIELFEQISQQGVYTEDDAKLLFKQVLEGIQYLHS